MIEDSDLLFSTKNFKVGGWSVEIHDDGNVYIGEDDPVNLSADDLQYIVNQAKMFRDRRFNYKARKK